MSTGSCPAGQRQRGRGAPARGEHRGRAAASVRARRPDLEDELGRLLGDGFDVHAALGRADEHGAAGGAVHQDRKVLLRGNVEGLGDHDLKRGGGGGGGGDAHGGNTSRTKRTDGGASRLGTAVATPS